MALPFVLGLAVGAGAVVAYNKSDKLKEKANKFFNKSKDVANDSLEKGKEAVSEVKQTINATADCIKERKEKTAIANNKEEKTIEDKDKEN
ncbi:hypothetical protein CP965_13135 [Halarcobacter mediterraneus]|uniref:YtxH domain-containing protein n=1 Tax=Halarcobacter mediterraneus TaxID=2023153 RepID=A0A4Q1ARP2_9BACT|nr:YtxH domain-containing protein [Halarcobacter mediterraneus]RXK11706.1 hypothetical protein CP965_13135 [Halarcobacter mediterraneus]